MASASFRSVGHVQPALWPRSCYCKHDWPQVDVLGCQIYRLRALLCRCSRSDTFTPPGDTPHPTSYTQDWHLLPDGLAAGSSCGVTLVQFSRPTGRPTGGKVHTITCGALTLLSRSKFWRERHLFSKVYFGLSFKALFDCISMIRQGAQKVNNQF